MLALVSSAVVLGAVGYPVTVEVHISSLLPGYTVVGLPDAAVRESRDRVRAAILSSGLQWPQRKITVNLAPSGLRKTGPGLDLPIAIGVLVASEQVPPGSVEGRAFVGELGLDGSVRRVAGVIPLADAVGERELVVSTLDAPGAGAVTRGAVRGIACLADLVVALRHDFWPPDRGRSSANEDAPPGAGSLIALRSGGCPDRPVGDLSDVRGQRVGRRAVEVAAAGGHHLLLVGPPGSGKTMLGHRVVGLLPDLTMAEALETSRVHSAAGEPLPSPGFLRRPPFRAPHHGASAVSLVGGGTAWMRPGEVSLATNGVLFLDEMGEFPAAVLDTLRQPLEEGVIRVTRARGSATFPARFQLVGAMNPCPCGEGMLSGRCRCSDQARARYTRRLSGPLLDRFDLVVPLHRPDPDELLAGRPGESTASVARRVAAVRARSRRRGASTNGQLAGEELAGAVELTPAAADLLERHVRTGRVSGRGLDRLRRVALTVSDLDPAGDGRIDERHVAEAVALHAGGSVFAPVRSER